LGKAVFCEKPAALCADDVRIMTDTLRAKGLPFMVGHVVRFFPEYEAARALVAEQRLGRVGVARFNRVSARPRGWNDWYRDPKLSGGTLFDLLIHDIDFVRWTLGPVARVFARTVTDSASGCDLSLATLRCQTGAIVHLFGSWAHGRFATRFEIAGSQGLITYDRDRARSLWLERSAVGKREEAGVEVPTAVGTLGPFEKELQAWVDCVNSGTDPPVSGEDGFEALRILEELRHSADTGQAQTLMNSGAADTSGTEGGLCP
jgi:predicted dehydrogenase